MSLLNAGTTTRTNWYSKMRKPFIENANVLIYGLAVNSVLLDKTNISQFRLTARNSIVCKTYPKIEVSFNITNWQSLSNSIKNYFSSKGNLIFIGFGLDDLVAEKKIPLSIYDYKLSIDGFTMSIKAHSVLQDFTEKASYELGKTPSALLTEIVNKKGWYSYYDGNAVSNDNEFNNMQPSLTDGELLQQMAIACGGFLHADTSVNTSTNTYIPRIIIRKTSDESNFYKRTIYKDTYSEYTAEENDNVEVLGVYDNAEKTDLGAVSVYVSSTAPSSLGITYKKTKNCYINSNDLVVKSYGGVVMTITSTIIRNDEVFVMFSNPSPNTRYFLYVSGYEQTLDTNQRDGITTISCGLLGDSAFTYDPTNYILDYYGSNVMAEWNGRVDPTIECCDNLTIVDTYSDFRYGYVEEIQVNFNGGLQGKIKMRCI